MTGLRVGTLFRGVPMASVIGFSVLANLLMLTGPLYMLQLYDRVLASGSMSTLYALTVLAALALVTMAVLETARANILGWAAARFDLAVGSRVLDASFEADKANGTGGREALRDVETVRNFVSGQGPITFLDAPWVPAYLLLIFLFHPLLGVIATAGAAVLFALAAINELASRRQQKQSASHLADARMTASSVLANSNAVAAMGLLPALRRRWQAAEEKGMAYLLRGGERTNAIQGMSRGTRHALQIAMLGSGAALAIEGTITAGVMIVASIIMGRALAPVEQAIGSWRAFQNARSSWARLKDLTDVHAPVADDKVLPEAQGRIELENVVCVAPGSDLPILRGISFAVDPGEFIAVIGPSGAGKSSLVRLLTGIWGPAAGSVRLDGARMTDYGADALNGRLGFVPQEVELLDGTIAENICRFADAPDEEEIKRVAQLAGAEEFILKTEQGYETLLVNGGHPLSGGQRQCIALARAAYGRPPVLILDEPTSSLDNDGEIALHNLIQDARANGSTVVLIAHKPSLVTQADKVLVLKNGTPQAFAPVDEILPMVTPPRNASPSPDPEIVGARA